MRRGACVVLIAAAARLSAQPAPPRQWVDAATGHRVVRLSDEAGSSTLYFHDNAFSPAGDRMMLRTPKGIAVVDVAKIGSDTAPLEIVAPGARAAISPGEHPRSTSTPAPPAAPGAAPEW
jgi:hypothetical protein